MLSADITHPQGWKQSKITDYVTQDATQSFMLLSCMDYWKFWCHFTSKVTSVSSVLANYQTHADEPSDLLSSRISSDVLLSNIEFTHRYSLWRYYPQSWETINKNWLCNTRCNSKLHVAKLHREGSVDRKIWYRFSALTFASSVLTNNQTGADGTLNYSVIAYQSGVC